MGGIILWIKAVLAHRRCSGHRAEILKSALCGCFYCLEIFKPGEIAEWISDPGVTAKCPRCSIDAVIGSASGYPVTKVFLEQMNKVWF